jgi:hypothetical protein
MQAATRMTLAKKKAKQEVRTACCWLPVSGRLLDYLLAVIEMSKI